MAALSVLVLGLFMTLLDLTIVNVAIPSILDWFFFFNDPATTEIYTSVHTLSLHDALPISGTGRVLPRLDVRRLRDVRADPRGGGRPAPAPGAGPARQSSDLHRGPPGRHPRRMGDRRHHRRNPRGLHRSQAHADALDSLVCAVHGAHGLCRQLREPPDPALPGGARAGRRVGTRHGNLG